MKINEQVCAALGLKNVRKLSLHFEVDKLPVVEAEMFLLNSEDEGGELQRIITQYTLMEKT